MVASHCHGVKPWLLPSSHDPTLSPLISRSCGWSGSSGTRSCPLFPVLPGSSHISPSVTPLPPSTSSFQLWPDCPYITRLSLTTPGHKAPHTQCTRSDSAETPALSAGGSQGLKEVRGSYCLPSFQRSFPKHTCLREFGSSLLNGAHLQLYPSALCPVLGQAKQGHIFLNFNRMRTFSPCSGRESGGGQAAILFPVPSVPLPSLGGLHSFVLGALPSTSWDPPQEPIPRVFVSSSLPQSFLPFAPRQPSSAVCIFPPREESHF